MHKNRAHTAPDRIEKYSMAAGGEVLSDNEGTAMEFPGRADRTDLHESSAALVRGNEQGGTRREASTRASQALNIVLSNIDMAAGKR